MLTSSFRAIRAGVETASASGDYVLITIPTGSNPLSVSPIVINERLGTTTVLDPSCVGVALGPTWVLMSCPQGSEPPGAHDVELYSLADRTRRTIALSPGMPYYTSPPYDPEVSCSAGDVGADWIEWDTDSYHHLPPSVYFQNIQTGELRTNPTNATTFADLNSPRLAHKTCPGVHLLPDPYPFGTGWGALIPYGRFALATDTSDSVFLERCGTSTRLLLADGNTVASHARASNAGAIVWQPVSNHLNGLFLPSLQTFTIPLPSAIVRPAGSSENTPVSALGLTSRALYLRDGWAGTLWRTASPSALPLNTSKPILTRAGSTLICRRGRGRRAHRFSYAWQVNGTARNGDTQPTLVVSRVGKRRRVSCSVTALNAAGGTTATSARVHTR